MLLLTQQLPLLLDVDRLPRDLSRRPRDRLARSRRRLRSRQFCRRGEAGQVAVALNALEVGHALHIKYYGNLEPPEYPAACKL